MAAADFNSLAPCGANPHKDKGRHPKQPFQLTRPVWGEPIYELDNREEWTNFNSLAPCGANLLEVYMSNMILKFQLTRPVWGEP